MRKDILIKIINGQALISSDTLGISSENLQGRIIFKPEPFVDGICRMYVEGKGSIQMEKQEDYYTLNILSSLLTSPYLDICFKITEPETEVGIPIFCSKIMHFKVLDTIDSSADIPEEYPSWEQVLDSKVAEIDNKLTEVTELQDDLEDKVESGYFKGDKGDSGKSAYQEWLDQGNTGTEQDFLDSLEGREGKPGAPGASGKDGQDGYTPVKGTDYFTLLEINEFTTTITNNVNNNIGLAVDSINGEVV